MLYSRRRFLVQSRRAQLVVLHAYSSVACIGTRKALADVLEASSTNFYRGTSIARGSNCQRWTSRIKCVVWRVVPVSQGPTEPAFAKRSTARLSSAILAASAATVSAKARALHVMMTRVSEHSERETGRLGPTGISETLKRRPRICKEEPQDAAVW